MASDAEVDAGGRHSDLLTFAQCSPKIRCQQGFRDFEVSGHRFGQVATAEVITAIGTSPNHEECSS